MEFKTRGLPKTRTALFYIVLFFLSNIPSLFASDLKDIKSKLNKIIIEDDINNIFKLNKNEMTGIKILSLQDFLKSKHPELTISVYLTPDAFMQKNVLDVEGPITGISADEALRYFCKINGLSLKWTEDSILIGIRHDIENEIPKTEENKLEYKTIRVQSIENDPLRIHLKSENGRIVCMGKYFSDLLEFNAYLSRSTKEIKAKGLIYEYSGKIKTNADESLLLELIRFASSNNIDLYVRYPLGKTPGHFYVKYIW